jgi:hypothetical protein
VWTFLILIILRLNVHTVLSSKAESKYERIYNRGKIGDSGNLYSLFVSPIVKKIISQPGIHRRENIHVENFFFSLSCDNASIFFLLNVKVFSVLGKQSDGVLFLHRHVGDVTAIFWTISAIIPPARLNSTKSRPPPYYIYCTHLPSACDHIMP